MRILSLTFCAFGLLIAAPAASRGEDAAPAAVAEEIRALRQTVEQQAKQIEALAQQVAKLTKLIEAKVAATPAGAPEQPAPPTPGDFATTEIRKAEPADGLPRHIIVKGETLTSVAKHYNVPLAELLKLNKITDDRKLQIGQELRIPAIKPPEKKENP